MANSVSKDQKSRRDWGIIQKKRKDGDTEWYARIVRRDSTGRKRQYLAKADNKSHARRLRDELDAKYSRTGAKGIEGDKLTFSGLAQHYRERRIKPPIYHAANGIERKVSGLRSHRSVSRYLDVLVGHFGHSRIRDISHSDIEDFRIHRLKTRSRRGERSIADVNRTLALLRAVLRYAVQCGWLVRSPFELGAPLISLSDEVRRDRVLTFEEEERFLAACNAERVVSYVRNGKSISATICGGREMIRALFITAVDTGMRKGEILGLRWSDVDLGRRVLRVTAVNSKTLRAREIGITDRLCLELEAVRESSETSSDDPVFKVSDFKRAFTNTCADAGIGGLRFHDLRHTAITRMVNAGLPPAEIMKISGHTQWTTFARYVNPTTDTIRKAANVLSQYVSERQNVIVSDTELLN